jgi:hypothetical protein
MQNPIIKIEKLIDNILQYYKMHVLRDMPY